MSTTNHDRHHRAHDDRALAPFVDDPAFELHRGGKIVVEPTAPIDGPDDLALAYTPYYLTYKYTGLAEYGAFWKVSQTGLLHTC